MTRPPHLPHIVIVRAPGLLPMLYTVAELARELGMPDRTLRDWLEFHDAPHQRDTQGGIWVDGTQFAAWIEQQRKPKRKYKLDDTSAFCFHCNTIVKLTEAHSHHIKGKLFHVRGRCPHCGTIVNRGARHAANDL